jgi:hypothetical protein
MTHYERDHGEVNPTALLVWGALLASKTLRKYTLIVGAAMVGLGIFGAMIERQLALFIWFGVIVLGMAAIAGIGSRLLKLVISEAREEFF